jgi:hypothetical protein
MFRSASAEEEFLPATDCAGAPSSALTFVLPPLGKWMGIFCSPSGHALVPKPGYLWVNKNAGVWMFFAHSVDKPTPLSNKHASYFIYPGYTHGRLSGDQLEFAYKILEANSRVKEKFEQAWYLTMQSNRNLFYTFYIFMNGDGPEWIVACVNRCAQVNVVQAGPIEKFKPSDAL